MSCLTVRLFKIDAWHLTIILPLFLVGCATGSAIKENYIVSTDGVYLPQEQIKKSAITEWVVMDPPIRTPGIAYFDSKGDRIVKCWSQISTQDKLNLLSNTRSEISIGKYSRDGTLTYLGATATSGKGSYKVIMDYTPYIIQDAIDPVDGKKIGDARVGIGLRLTANVTTKKRDINLGSLIALGIAAKSDQLQGSLHIDTIGIRPKNNSGITLTTTIDETSILNAMQALAILQTKIAESDTYLDPQVIWVKPLSSVYKANEVAQQMKEPFASTVPANFSKPIVKIHTYSDKSDASGNDGEEAPTHCQ